MTDEPRRRIIEVGVLPSGNDVVYVGEGSTDPIVTMIAAANARLDAERAAEAKALAAKAADIARLQNTRRARAARRFRKALRAFVRLR